MIRMVYIFIAQSYRVWLEPYGLHGLALLFPAGSDLYYARSCAQPVTKVHAGHKGG